MRQPFALRLIGILFSTIGAGSLALALYFLTHQRLLPEEDGWILIPMLCLVGTVFLLVGLGLRFFTRPQDRRLMETGERILARVVEVERNSSLSVNGRHPYRLLCEYEEGGIVVRCRSDNLWQRPVLENDWVPIYRDPSNPRRYYVDVEAALRPTLEL